MRRRLIFLAALNLLLVSGCTIPGPGRKPNALTEAPELTSLDRAELLRTQGDHVAATIEYRKVIESAQNDYERDEARIGAAKSLIAIHEHAPALAVLGNLPAGPASEQDCRRLAIAGEIYLRQHRPKDAEICLELALDSCPLEDIASYTVNKPNRPRRDRTGPPAAVTQAAFTAQAPPYHADPGVEPFGGDPAYEPIPTPPGHPPISPHGTMLTPLPMAQGDPPPAWLAGCCANLGNAYLKNDKPEKAAVMYSFAADLFRLCGNHVASERAERIRYDLDSVLRQYAPYKPSPLAKGLPPGSY